ncbi:xanthine dehydrogenase family protein subunit M [Alteribacillus sp. YIM 98480]|uniref:FAD binding domain-containing protein n=1 Tax=Alteribacillus sp. YIM 98480 TaxID=2606599 RepID=UPI00131BA38D|nr:xanthine dehydrogenase family protein subunit M [Alteribacillus sp. YIM 98480]
MSEFLYHVPNNLDDLFSTIKKHGSSAALLAGGTDLLIHLKVGKIAPQHVIDIKHVKELYEKITFCSNGMTIGALTTLINITKHPDVQKLYPALSESARKVGSKQIRNRGTLVGNICNASPAADTAPALLIYNAEVTIVGMNSRRTIPFESFIKGPGKTDLKEGEIVESLFFPFPPANSTSNFVKLARREGADLTIVGTATLAASNYETRIALCAVAPIPFRACSAEYVLNQGGYNQQNIDKALEKVVHNANPISDLRATKEYRLAMVEVITRKSLENSLKILTN